VAPGGTLARDEEHARSLAVLLLDEGQSGAGARRALVDAWCSCDSAAAGAGREWCPTCRSPPPTALRALVRSRLRGRRGWDGAQRGFPRRVTSAGDHERQPVDRLDTDLLA
jgi:hypothetical protein